MLYDETNYGAKIVPRVYIIRITFRKDSYGPRNVTRKNCISRTLKIHVIEII